MTAITINNEFAVDRNFQHQEVFDKIALAFKKEFDNVKLKAIKREETKRSFACRVKTKLFNPVVSLKGKIATRLTDDKAKVLIEADTRTNGWFWFTLLMFCLFPPLFILLIWMFSSQKKQSKSALQNVAQRLEFEFSAS